MQCTGGRGFNLLIAIRPVELAEGLDRTNRSCLYELCFESERNHDDVIKWKPFPRYWPFVQGIHRWPVNDVIVMIRSINSAQSHMDHIYIANLGSRLIKPLLKLFWMKKYYNPQGKMILYECLSLASFELIYVSKNGPWMAEHDDVIKWKHFPRNWPFVRGIHRSRWIPHTKASDAEL